jgi:hypothetical protein
MPAMPIFDEPMPMAESSRSAVSAASSSSSSSSKPFAGFRRAAGLLRKQRSEASFGNSENRGASSSSRSSGSTRSSPFDDAEPAPVAPTTSMFESWEEGDEATPKGPGRILKRSPRKNENNDLRRGFFGSGAGRGSGRQRSESVGDRARVKGSVLLGLNSNQVMGRNLEAAIDQAGGLQPAAPSMPTPRASRTAQASPWSSQLAAPFPDVAASSSVYSQHHGAGGVPRIGSTDSLELLALDFPPPPPVSAPVRPQLRGSSSVGALRKNYRMAGGVGTGRTSLEIMADTISPSPLPLRTRRGVDPLSISLAQVAAGGPSRRRTTVRSPHGVHSPPPCPPPSTPLPEVPLTPAFEYASFSARSSALQSPAAHSRTASGSSGAGGETKDSRSRASTQTAISDYGDSELSYGCDSATSSGSSPFTPLTPLDRGGLDLASEEATPSKTTALSALDFDLQSPVLFSLSNALALDAPRCVPAVVAATPEDDDAVYGYAM